jgi:hypothetical protein
MWTTAMQSFRKVEGTANQLGVPESKLVDHPVKICAQRLFNDLVKICAQRLFDMNMPTLMHHPTSTSEGASGTMVCVVWEIACWEAADPMATSYLERSIVMLLNVIFCH